MEGNTAVRRYWGRQGWEGVAAVVCRWAEQWKHRRTRICDACSRNGGP